MASSASLCMLSSASCLSQATADATAAARTSRRGGGHGAGAGGKLADYFRPPSVRHYLLVRTERPTVIHHRRADGDVIETRIVTAGLLQLDPPGLTLDLGHVYA